MMQQYVETTVPSRQRIVALNVGPGGGHRAKRTYRLVRVEGFNLFTLWFGARQRVLWVVQALADDAVVDQCQVKTRREGAEVCKRLARH